jgi:hypothetical protein
MGGKVHAGLRKAHNTARARTLLLTDLAFGCAFARCRLACHWYAARLVVGCVSGRFGGQGFHLLLFHPDDGRIDAGSGLGSGWGDSDAVGEFGLFTTRHATDSMALRAESVFSSLSARPVDEASAARPRAREGQSGSWPCAASAPGARSQSASSAGANAVRGTRTTRLQRGLRVQAPWADARSRRAASAGAGTRARRQTVWAGRAGARAAAEVQGPGSRRGLRLLPPGHPRRGCGGGGERQPVSMHLLHVLRLHVLHVLRLQRSPAFVYTSG